MSRARAVAPPVFHFDAEDHVYTLGGVIIPSVTQMLERAGHISEAFYTAESAERGSQVHRLCTDYDLGAIEDLVAFESLRYKGWLLAYAAFTRTVPHEWTSVEVALCSVRYRFGGRPDRAGKLWGVEGIVELKSGPPEAWHGVQTALHDILLSETEGLPIGVRQRWGLYLKKTGRFKLIPHDGKEPSCSEGRRDYDKAYEVIRGCTR